MKIKNDNIEFESFSDGICEIFSYDESEAEVSKYASLGFSNKTMGFKRYFAAAAERNEISKVIRIPAVKNVDAHDMVRITGGRTYEIVLTQDIMDSNPPSIALTLKAGA